MIVHESQLWQVRMSYWNPKVQMTHEDVVSFFWHHGSSSEKQQKPLQRPKLELSSPKNGYNMVILAIFPTTHDGSPVKQVEHPRCRLPCLDLMDGCRRACWEQCNIETFTAPRAKDQVLWFESRTLCMCVCIYIYKCIYIYIYREYVDSRCVYCNI